MFSTFISQVSVWQFLCLAILVAGGIPDIVWWVRSTYVLTRKDWVYTEIKKKVMSDLMWRIRYKENLTGWAKFAVKPPYSLVSSLFMVVAGLMANWYLAVIWVLVFDLIDLTYYYVVRHFFPTGKLYDMILYIEQRGVAMTRM